MKIYYKFRMIATVLWSGKVKKRFSRTLKDYAFVERMPSYWLEYIATSADKAEKILRERFEQYVTNQVTLFQTNGKRLVIVGNDENHNHHETPCFHELNMPIITFKEMKVITDYSKVPLERAIKELTMEQCKEMFESIPLDKT